MKTKLIFSTLMFLVVLYGYSQHEGTLTKRNVSIKNCNFSSLTVKYKVGSFFGEPTVNGAYKLTGSDNCKAHYNTTIWLKIQSGGSYGYIRLAPTVPKTNEGYGYNVTGSPDWDDFICGYSGNKKNNCMTEEQAKNLYKNGRITGFEVGW